MIPRRNAVPLATFLVLVLSSAMFGADRNPSPPADSRPGSTDCQSLGQPNPLSFVDPTVCVYGDTAQVFVDSGVYIAPFAVLTTGQNLIVIGKNSNVQDSVLVDATNGNITLGEEAILAHGATVTGPTTIGVDGVCPDLDAHHCPSFLGFNAVVNASKVQKNAMVLHLARVDGGTITSGKFLEQGKWVSPRQGGGEDGRTGDVDQSLIDFMAAVVHVNEAFAAEYPVLVSHAGDDSVYGINFNPETEFNEHSVLPTLAGVATQDPDFRNRIIGPVTMTNSLAQLGPGGRVMGNQVSLRGDEGFPFTVGRILRMSDNFTMHALENEDDKMNPIILGSNGSYGTHSIVHGGGHQLTVTGNNFTLGERAVFFKSQMTGATSIVGNYSLVENSKYEKPMRVGNCTIVVENTISKLEWSELVPGGCN